CEKKDSVPESHIDDIRQKVSRILFSKDDLNKEQVKVAISSTVQRILNICSAPHPRSQCAPGFQTKKSLVRTLTGALFPIIALLKDTSKSQVYLADIRKTEEAEIAILLCLLECQKSDFDRKLQLAIHWRRAQVAESKIFTAAAEKGVSLFDPTYEHSSKIYQYFTNILIDDQLDFIKLFIDHGFPISRYLTIDQLRQLYRRSI
uniref:TRPM-like domain-containing protein n=1 Tax=Romanomermis culicivorax TaxID=13658 RepID=A0A915HL54_ROMCU